MTDSIYIYILFSFYLRIRKNFVFYLRDILDDDRCTGGSSARRYLSSSLKCFSRSKSDTEKLFLNKPRAVNSVSILIFKKAVPYFLFFCE